MSEEEREELEAIKEKVEFRMKHGGQGRILSDEEEERAEYLSKKLSEEED